MYYKDTENNLHFLDSIEFEHLLPKGCVRITDSEATGMIAQRRLAREQALNALKLKGSTEGSGI